MTSEDTGAYGLDIGVTLPELLYAVVAVLPEGTMLRLGMTNPPYIRHYLSVRYRSLSLLLLLLCSLIICGRHSLSTLGRFFLSFFF